MKRYLSYAVVAVIAASVTVAVPVMARSVVRFAKNAGHVDGFHAVGFAVCHQPSQPGPQPPQPSPPPRCERRPDALVATNDKGFLPNDLIKKPYGARDADALGGLGPSRYSQLCEDGAVAGYASVPSNVSSSWTQVTGFGLGGTLGPFPGSSSCNFGTPQAERLSTGVYEVALPAGSFFCQASRSSSAQVTVEGSDPLIATHEALCDPDKGAVEKVHIFDLSGAPTDAGFVITVYTAQFQYLP